MRATWRAGPVDRLPAQEDALRIILQDRGEPTHALVLRAGLLAAWGQTATLTEIAQQSEGEQTPLAVLRSQIDRAWSAASLREIEPHRWWLMLPPEPPAPLADRVEQRARDLLREHGQWHGDALLQRLYRDFPDQLTPDRALIATVIHSYAEDIHFEHSRLRAEDLAAARDAEVNEVCRLLQHSGERLGVEVSRETNLDEQHHIVWTQAGDALYHFWVQTTAEIRPMLRENFGVLVIPGGRATLLQHKIARDARLQNTRWQVLKFSSLRRAAQQTDLTLQTFPLAFGLEPPIEQAAMQIQLL